MIPISEVETVEKQQHDITVLFWIYSTDLRNRKKRADWWTSKLEEKISSINFFQTSQLIEWFWKL